MNILFMTIGNIESIEAHTIYCDLLRCFRDHGHDVYTISPYERRMEKDADYKHENGIHMLHVRTGNIKKTSNLIEKGIATLSIESIFIRNIRKYFSNIKFDLILYSTPPITFCNAIRFVKNRDQAKTYLMLKDIFPQNAVDIGMMKKVGIKGLIYKFFRRKEKKLYSISDRIGCMSQANVDYVIKHNPEINRDKVEICPNSIEVIDKSVSLEERIAIRNKYNIPIDKVVFIYGGNLGKPQGIPFLIQCLESQKKNKEAFFLVVGDGTEYGKLEKYKKGSNQSNFRLMRRLPKEDYDVIVGACDVGMIFLDHRFTIPNFPSRLLSYMQAKLPVLACTDPNTDIGKVITEGGFGWWCESDDIDSFYKIIRQIINDINYAEIKGENGFQILKRKYNVTASYKVIMKSVHYFV